MCCPVPCWKHLNIKQILQDSLKFCKIHQDSARINRILQDSFRFCKILLDISWHLRNFRSSNSTCKQCVFFFSQFPQFRLIKVKMLWPWPINTASPLNNALTFPVEIAAIKTEVKRQPCQKICSNNSNAHWDVFPYHK